MPMTITPDQGPAESWKPEAPEAAPIPDEPGVNGRRFVLGSLGVIAVGWAVLFAILAPGMWSYKKQAEFGRTQVAPVVFGFQKAQPPGVDPRDWDRTVGEAHSLVQDATRSGKLSVEEQTALREDIQAAVDRSKQHPESAVRELGTLWDHVAVIARKVRPEGAPDVDHSHPRPSMLPESGGR